MLPSSGSPAPGFSLPDQDGRVHSLKDYARKWLLIYFYPNDDTPTCTTEACAIRDRWAEFAEAGLEVVGISANGVKSHAKFARKYDLPFTLLADDELEAVNMYGVWQEKKFMGRTFMGTVRTSFLIDPNAKIAKVYEKVRAARHAEEVLADFLRIKGA